MTQKEMFGGAQWVSAPGCAQPQIRGEFVLPEEAVKAEITVCGLGFFELYANGRRVSGDLLVPAWTDYEDHRFECNGHAVTDRFSHRVLCLKYDLTPFLKKGANAVGAVLGAGWYKKIGYGEPKLCWSLTVEDISGATRVFESGESLRWAQSPVLESRVLYGETHDWRLETPGWSEAGFDDSPWKPVAVVPAPGAEFFVQECPADAVIRYIEPKLIKKFLKYSVYDAGENITGWPVVATESKRGTKVRLQYTELLNGRGLLDSTSYTYKHSRKKMQTDVYITDGTGREMHPRFLWHAFRYFSVTNNASVKTCAVVHADVPVTSAFECSNKTLNWFYRTYVQTQLFNMHAGIPSDCPQREGRGYTGDGQLACGAAMLTLGAQSFYQKWLGDIADCQDKATGHVQYTAPYFPSGGGPGGWGCAVVVVPYAYYKHYGDIQTLRDFYPRMLDYFRYLEDHSENGLVTSDQPWAWCLGDWCTPDKIQIPEPLVNNYFYIKSMETVKKIAALIGEKGIAPLLDRRIAERKEALVKTYFDEASGSFAGGIQGADAFMLDIGLGTEKTFQNVVEKYSRLGMYDTGIFGTDILTRLLFERGFGQLAFDLLAGEKKTSYYTMMARGATTLWEYWDGRKSQSHPMFGAPVKTLFEYLLGIRQTESSAGFREIVIEPVVVDGLDFSKGHITTMGGKIAVAWKKQTDGVAFEVEIPEGISAEFRFGEYRQTLRPGNNTYTRKG